MQRLRVGEVVVDPLTFAESVDAVAELVERRQGGYVVTPNIDHVVQAEENEAFRQAYQSSSLSLVDGMPIVWASRLLEHRLPERICGTDLIPPLMVRAASKAWRVYFMGGAPGVAE